MEHFTHASKLYFFGIIIYVSLLTASASSQTRAIGAGALVLDDGLGQTITLQTPNGGWTGNIPFIIPIPPSGESAIGFCLYGNRCRPVAFMGHAARRRSAGIVAAYSCFLDRRDYGYGHIGHDPDLDRPFDAGQFGARPKL